VVLLLNKADEFREQLLQQQLSSFFPAYTGDNTFDDAVDYLLVSYAAALLSHCCCTIITLLLTVVTLLLHFYFPAYTGDNTFDDAVAYLLVNCVVILYGCFRRSCICSLFV
jgi:hypothetical protein